MCSFALLTKPTDQPAEQPAKGSKKHTASEHWDKHGNSKYLEGNIEHE
jgi:hypothetical protein